MNRINFKKIGLGLVFIFFSGISLLAAVYSLEIKPERTARDSASLKKLKASEALIEQRVKDIQETRKGSSPPAPSPSKETSQKTILQEGPSVKEPLKQEVRESVISLKSLVEEAKGVYGQEEMSRQEGFLWVDRKSSKVIVTLGAIHGLLPGKQLTFYDGDKKIGQVVVDLALDAVSFVHPISQSMDILENNYYRVVAE